MKIFRSLNKEQWTAVAAGVLCTLFLLLGMAGGGASGGDVPVAAEDRAYERSPARFPQFVDASFDGYWQGRHIFKAEAAARLPVPAFRAPEPPAGGAAAPLFIPGPSLEAYNRMSLALKYPVPAKGKALIAEASLPRADLEGLFLLEAVEVEPRRDRRAEKDREYFTVTLKTGGRREGTLLLETAIEIHMTNAKTGQREVWGKDKLVGWEYNRTHEDLYLEEARRVSPGPREAEERTALARRLLDLGMIPEAKAELKRALESEANRVEAILLLGRIAFDAGDLDGAVSIYEAGLASGAPAGDLHHEIGRCLQVLSFHEGAAASFRRAIDVSPRLRASRLALARCRLSMGSFEAAAGTAEGFVEKFDRAGDTPAEERIEARLLRGLALLGLGRTGPAQADLSAAAEAGRAEAVNAIAVVAALGGEWGRAGAGFVSAIRKDPYRAEAWTNLGTLFLLGGDPAGAERLYAEAERRDPSFVEAAVGMAVAQLAEGKPEAAETLDRAIRMDPAHGPARMVRGALRLEAGALDAALAEFTMALRANPAYLPAYVGAAKAYLGAAEKMSGEGGDLRREGMRLRALALLRAVKDSDPNQPAAWTALGCACASAGLVREARQALRMAASLRQAARAPADPLVSYALGYVETRDPEAESDEARLEAALREFTEAAGTDPAATGVAADARRAVESIEEWKVTALRLDERFEREASDVVGANWLESDDRYGVAVTLEHPEGGGGRARFAGRQAIADLGITTLAREIPAEDFYAMEATFRPEKVDRAEFGLSLLYSRQGESRIGFHVGVDAQGKARFNPHAAEPGDMDRRDMTTGWMEIRTPPPDPREVRIRVTRGEKNRIQQFTIWFWSAAEGGWIPAHRDIPMSLTGSESHWRISIFGRAWRDQEIAFTVDDVRVYERQRR